MKILIVTQHFWPEDFRINELSQDFVNKGHEVCVLTGTPNYPEGKIYPDYIKNKENYSTYNSINIKRLPVFPRGRNKFTLLCNYLSFVFSGIFFGPIILRKYKFDLIFVFEPSPISVCIPAIFLKYLKKSKICLWVLDLWPQSLYAVGYFKKEALVIKIVRRIVRYIYSKCDIILGTSQSFVKEIKKDCNPDKIVKFFPNWYETFYENHKVEPATQIPRTELNFNLIFAGNLGDAQDIPTIIDAMYILKDYGSIKLYIIGDGKRYSWLKKIIRDKELEHNIHLLGRHSSKKMPSFFLNADALIVSLKPHEVYDQTIPGKLQSYLISKKPIIGMLGGEGAEIINQSKCGINAIPGNPDSMADAILELSKLDRSSRHKLAENGFNYAKNHYNKDMLFNKLNNWLVEVLD